MTEKYYVICGTRDEFQRFVTKKAADMWLAGDTNVTLSNFVFVNDSTQLKGVSCPHGWFVGTWRDRSNIHEIVLELGFRHGSANCVVPESIKTIARELKVMQ